MSTSTKYTPEEVVERGEVIYEASIRQQVEPGNLGKLLMIDIETGAWFLGTDRLEMARRARAANPDAQLYGLKIGYPATMVIGGTLRPIGATEEDYRIIS